MKILYFQNGTKLLDLPGKTVSPLGEKNNASESNNCISSESGAAETSGQAHSSHKEVGQGSRSISLGLSQQGATSGLKYTAKTNSKLKTAPWSFHFLLSHIKTNTFLFFFLTFLWKNFNIFKIRKNSKISPQIHHRL